MSECIPAGADPALLMFPLITPGDDSFRVQSNLQWVSPGFAKWSLQAGMSEACVGCEGKHMLIG